MQGGSDRVLWDVEFATDLGIGLVFEIESANEIGVGSVERVQQAVNFVFVVDVGLGGTGLFPFLFDFGAVHLLLVDGPAAELVHDDSASDDGEVARHARLASESAKHFEVAIDNGRHDVSGEVLGIVGVQHHATHMGGVLNDVEDDPQVSVDKLAPSLGLALEASADQLSIDFRQGHRRLHSRNEIPEYTETQAAPDRVGDRCCSLPLIGGRTKNPVRSDLLDGQLPIDGVHPFLVFACHRAIADRSENVVPRGSVVRIGRGFRARRRREDESVLWKR